MWYQFIKESGRKDIEQMFGPDAYDCVKDLPPKFQPPAAYFSSNGINCNDISRTFSHIARIIEKNPKHTISYSKNGVTFNGKVYTHDLWIDFNEEVDAIFTALFPPNVDETTQFDEDLPYKTGAINVVKIHNVNEAIQYGAGMTWCISQPFNTMWQSYRDTQASTFYFVFDGTKKDNDPLRRVAVDFTNEGVKLTDVNNTTGSIANFGEDANAYLEYLAKQGVDVSQFKNDPWTPEEKLEAQWISENIYGLEDFKNLKNSGIPNVYSRYIGRGHHLDSQQYDWLHEIGAKNLITQYVGTGRELTKDQQQKLNNQQKRTYIINRNRMYHQLENMGDDVTYYGDDFHEKRNNMINMGRLLAKGITGVKVYIDLLKDDPLSVFNTIFRHINTIEDYQELNNQINLQDYIIKNKKFFNESIKYMRWDILKWFVDNNLINAEDFAPHKDMFLQRSNTEDLAYLLKLGLIEKEDIVKRALKRDRDLVSLINCVESGLITKEDLGTHKLEILDKMLLNNDALRGAMQIGLFNSDDFIPLHERIIEILSTMYNFTRELNLLVDLGVLERTFPNDNASKIIDELIRKGDFNVDEGEEFYPTVWDSMVRDFGQFSKLIDKSHFVPWRDAILRKILLSEDSLDDPVEQRISDLVAYGVFDEEYVHSQSFKGTALKVAVGKGDPWLIDAMIGHGYLTVEELTPYKEQIVSKLQIGTRGVLYKFFEKMEPLVSSGLLKPEDLASYKPEVLRLAKDGWANIMKIGLKLGIINFQDLVSLNIAAGPFDMAKINELINEGHIKLSDVWETPRAYEFQRKQYYVLGPNPDSKTKATWHQLSQADLDAQEEFRQQIRQQATQPAQQHQRKPASPAQQPTQPEPEPDVEASFNFRKYLNIRYSRYGF